MKSKVTPLRIPENLDNLAQICSQEQHTDKATVLRQWLYKGAELYAVKLVADGRISASYAAQLLDLTIYDVFRIAEENRIELGPTEEQTRLAMEYAKRLSAGTRQTTKT
ncbi:MAG: hypothetical protein HY681_14865 [Chloroflexi bacterium]|nr:hypothetical protein [Chloroflexota bacterium]